MEFPGKGKRRPLIDIELSKINLDIENPRLAKLKERDSATQFDLIRTLFLRYDLEELALSLSENGYFDEEPIIVVPTKVPPSVTLDGNAEPEVLQFQLNKLLENADIEFTVVEGNRRIATAKILTDSSLRRRLNAREESFPYPKSSEIAEDLKVIPAIVYFDRKFVAPYLGVRHITGLSKWEAFAKAVYIARNIEENVAQGININESIRKVQMQVADRSDVIKKQYLCYKVMKQAEEDISFDTKNIKDKFSLLTVALNSPSIRNYIGCPNHKEANFSGRVIPINKLDHLKNTLTWIYGDGNREPVLSDSRKITSELAPVLLSEEATAYLIDNNNLQEAFQRSKGERDYIIRKITTASSSIRYSLGYAWKYKTDKEIKASVSECLQSILELQKMINSK